jgi:hypothetical protein
MKEEHYIRVASPAIYNITAPEAIRRRNGFSNINNWGWINYGDLKHCIFDIHTARCATFGKPAVTITWATTGVFELFNSFGLLMSSNEDVQSPVVYTYVRCSGHHIPEEKDFFLLSFEIPRDPDFTRESLYVPAGWGLQVMKFVRAGVFLIRSDRERNVRIAHHTNGENRILPNT